MVARQLDEVVVPRGDGPLIAFEEFLARTSDGERAEWVEGEWIEIMPPDERHQDIVLFLATLLNLFVRARSMGKIIVSPFRMNIREGSSYREPDLVFVASANLHRLNGKQLNGPADLVVEVVSPESVSRDRRDKLWDYATAGIPEYWIIDPRPNRTTFEAFELSNEGYYSSIPADLTGRVVSNVLSGFAIDADWFRGVELPDPLLILDRT